MKSQKLRKLIVAAAFLLLPVVSAMSGIRIQVYDASSHVIFSGFVEDHPSFDFTDDGLEIKSATMSTVLERTNFSSIGRIEFQEGIDPSSIFITEADVVSFQFTDNQKVRLDGINEKSAVALFTMDGKQVTADISRRKQHVEINLGHLPQGYYIIKTNIQSFKILKK